MKDLFWIGIQESEIENTYNLFEGSITIFGSNSNNNFAFEKKYNKRYDYNQDSELWNEFVNSTVKYILKSILMRSFYCIIQWIYLIIIKNLNLAL